MRVAVLLVFAALGACASARDAPLDLPDAAVVDAGSGGSTGTGGTMAGGVMGTGGSTIDAPLAPADGAVPAAIDAAPAPSCPPATPMACGGTCVNPTTDPKHCGSCEYACESSYQRCAAGVCSLRYDGTKITGAVPGTIWALAVSPDGSIFVAGTFKGTVDFNPGTPVENVTALGANGDVYLSRFDAQGAYAWTRTLPSAIGVSWVGAAASTDGGVLLSGYYQGTIDFMGAYGGASRTAHTMGADEGYLLKVRADGTFGFVRTFPSGYSSVFRAVPLADGGAALAGPFLGPVDFGDGFQLDGVSGGYVARLSPSGATTWVKTFPGGVMNTVAESSAGSIVAAGSYTGMLDLDPGAGAVMVSSGMAKAMMVVRLDGAGQYLSGASVAMHARDVVPEDVQTDGASIYTIGRVADGMVPTAPDPDPRPRATAGDYDGFVIKHSADGQLGWGRVYGGPAYDYAQRLALLPDGLMVTGAFASPSIDVCPGGTADVRQLTDGRLFVTGLGADGSCRGAFTLKANPISLRADGSTLNLGGSWGGTTDFNPRTDDKDERSTAMGAGFISAFRL